MKNKRAPRCPEGYVSRTYRTDPKIHEAARELADKKNKPGGAGQLITETLIEMLKRETGRKFKNGFEIFYKTKDISDKEYQSNLKKLEEEAGTPRGILRQREAKNARK